MRKQVALMFLLGLCVTCARGDADTSGSAEKRESQLEQKLKTVLLNNFTATEKGSVDGVAETLHTRSPARDASLDVLRQFLETYKLRAELLEFRFVGIDGDYAIARGKQRITKIEGPAFSDSVTDSLYVFRAEAGVWKLWQQCALETQLLN